MEEIRLNTLSMINIENEIISNNTVFEKKNGYIK